MAKQPDWADEAREEREFYDSVSIPQLHEFVHTRQFGKTYSIWYSIAERSTLPVSAWPLLEVLDKRSVHRMFRFHAAAALLRMMDSHEWNAETLADDDAPEFDTRLRDFRRAVMEEVRLMTR